MRRFDIREYKTKLRLKYRQIRTDMPPEVKAAKDAAILERLTKTNYYKNAKTVLAYVSTPIEVDTRALIRRCWEDGKTIAVPRCVDNSRNMFFYEINSFEELEPHTFGVLEPIPHKTKRIQRFKGAICIVPGLAFDNSGFRLGYGKGYYDRFLSGQFGKQPKIGICYRECIRYAIHHGRYDVPCDIVINDEYTRYLTKR